MITGVIILFTSQCLTKQHLCVTDGRHVLVRSGRTPCDTSGSSFDKAADACSFISLRYYTLWSHYPDWWLCARRRLYVYRTAPHIPHEALLYKHPAPESCVCQIQTDRELEMLCGRIWDMLMKQHNKKPSSRSRWKKNEKLLQRIVFFKFEHPSWVKTLIFFGYTKSYEVLSKSTFIKRHSTPCTALE